jgi:hypothetical protein
VTISADGFQRNVTLGQGVFNSTGDRLEVRLRTTNTGSNGTNPSMQSPVGALNAQLQHVVYTRDAAGIAKLYVDGVEVGSATISGDLSNWNSGYEFALANELTGDRPWLGAYDLVAVYDDALTPAEVAQNFLAGPVVDPPANVTGLIVNGSSTNFNRSGIATLALTFDRPVTIAGAGSLSLFNHSTGASVDVSAAVLLNNGTSTVTWELIGIPLVDGWYTAELPAAAASPNLVSTQTVVFSKLEGDLDGDGAVNFNDTIPLSINFGSSGGVPFQEGDSDGDGLVNFNDTVPLSFDFGTSLEGLTYDFGDAPETGTEFPTTLANGAAYHVATGNSLFLGGTRDVETDGQPTGNANGDGADEDGVAISVLEQGTSAAATVNSSGAGFVNGWIDFNQDGDWDDPDEQVFMDVPVVSGENNLQFDVPAGAVLGSTFARFRLTGTAGYSYAGLAPTGEVEDYSVTITDAGLDVAMDVAQVSVPVANLNAGERSSVAGSIERKLWGTFGSLDIARHDIGDRWLISLSHNDAFTSNAWVTWTPGTQWSRIRTVRIP